MIPSDTDTDPNRDRILFEIVVRINPDAPFAAAAAAVITQKIIDRTGITPVSVTIDAGGVATVVVPDTSIDVGFWVAWVASAMAAIPRTGIVQAIGNRARVTAAPPPPP